MAKKGKATTVESRDAPAVPAVRFVDFSVRAWREGPYVQVMAHATPAGAMRQPTAVKVGKFVAADYRLPIDAPLAQGAEIGRELARIILPPDVWRLLAESLAGIASRDDLGLRLRLCLDDDLIDLPWEFLYRPDVDAPAAQSGFLLTDGRLSLTREPPSIVGLQPSSDRTQRGLFVGTLWDDKSDGWAVKTEFDSLRAALTPVGALMDFAFAPADAMARVDKALSAGCEVFHYSGHIDVGDGRGAMVHRARAAALRNYERARRESGVEIDDRLEAVKTPADWADSEVLAPRLAAGGTRLAVFNACNSGLWPFVRPLMRAGVPAVVGVQGLVTNLAAMNFAEKFYQSLAVGLSLDEAMTYARLYVMQPERSYYPCDWGRFMAYMPADSAVLFPRPAKDEMKERQHAVRVARAETLNAMPAVTRKMDGEGVSRMLSEVASRSVLILGRFTATRKPVLDLIRRELSTAPHRYVPILFDFDRPKDRTMVESVLRFAAVSRFVIADLSDPKWVLAELQQVVPAFRSLPVVPIIDAAQRENEVIAHFEGYQSVHKVVRYRDQTHLKTILASQIVKAGEAMYETLKPRAVID
jgi:hypothetical protein